MLEYVGVLSLMKENLLEILAERSHTFYKPINVHYVIRFFDKHVKYSESLVSCKTFM